MIDKDTLTMRAWDADAPGRLSGWMELAGIDSAEQFKSRKLQHPAVGQRVKLPMGTGVIEDCIIHPQGKLLFDVKFDYPIPPFIDHLSDDREQFERHAAHDRKLGEPEWAVTQWNNGVVWKFLGNAYWREEDATPEIPGVTNERSDYNRFFGDILAALLIEDELAETPSLGISYNS